MLARCAGSGSLWRRIELALAVATVAALASSPALAAVPLFGQGAAGLVAPGGVDPLAKPAAAAAGQAAGAAAGEAAATPADPNAALKKYAPSYALLLLVVGLGVFIVCRPSPRPVTEQKTDKKSEKKKK